MNQPLLSVIMPVYNERETLPEILDRVRAVDLRRKSWSLTMALPMAPGKY